MTLKLRREHSLLLFRDIFCECYGTTAQLREVIICFSLRRMQVQEGSDSWTLTVGDNVAQIFGDPLRIDFLSGGKKVAVFNGRSTLKFEHLRRKPEV